jgi:Glucose-6-phosphate dehydrogenase, C-terminal domain
MIFLVAAEELPATPARCFVVEDAAAACRRPRLARSSCESIRTRACGCSCPLWADGPGAPSALGTSFARELGEPPELYEVLLHAAMVGDHQYFAREDSVEETLRIVQPLLDRPPRARPCPRGSWGPVEAEIMLRGHPRWRRPWLPEKGAARDGLSP